METVYMDPALLETVLWKLAFEKSLIWETVCVDKLLFGQMPVWKLSI